MSTANLNALLAVIRRSEDAFDLANPYAATYACNVTKFFITDFSDHPALLGWQGVMLDSSKFGVQYFNEVSTAAGAYQIIKPTWVTLKARLRLPDFSPASQDLAGIELVREAGALDLINSGQFVLAVAQCSKTWASLPGSTSGQPQNKMASLLQLYGQSGGGFA